MPLVAEVEGVFVLSGDSGELLLSAAGFRFAGESRALEHPGPLVSWNDVQTLRVLPDRWACLGRIAAFVVNLALSNVWTAGGRRVGCRLEIRQSDRVETGELHLSRKECRDLETLTAWINDHLRNDEELAQLNSGRPFWRTGL